MENVGLLKEYVKTGVASYAFRPWKVGLLLVAAILVAIGGGLSLVEETSSESPQLARSDDRPASSTEGAATDDIVLDGVDGTSAGAKSLIGDLPPGIDLDFPPGETPPINPDPDEDPTPTPDQPANDSSPGEPRNDAENEISSAPIWSPAFLKGGFGFFIGFCVGFAIRTLLRLAAIMVGLNVLVLMIFASLGWVEVHWDVIGNQFDLWVDGFGADFRSIESFVLGRLPATGLTALGLYTGLRRK